MYKLLRVVLFCIGLTILMIVPVRGQNAGELTVEESVRMGLEHNFRLRAARADRTGCAGS